MSRIAIEEITMKYSKVFYFFFRTKLESYDGRSLCGRLIYDVFNFTMVYTLHGNATKGSNRF